MKHSVFKIYRSKFNSCYNLFWVETAVFVHYVRYEKHNNQDENG